MSEFRTRPGGGGGRHRVTPISSAQALRVRADEILRTRDVATSEPLSPAAAQKVIHDLRVHQIELELQNEELRRTQDALEIARGKYFDLFDRAPVGYFTLNEAGLILEANRTGAQLLFVDRAALIRQPLSLFVLREDQDAYYLACRTLVRTEADHAFELRMAKSDGRAMWVWIDATVSEGDDGEHVWHMAVTDITARKASEQALRTAEQLRESWRFFRQIAESVPQLVWTSDADGAWDYLGPQWKEFTGFPEAEQLGLGWVRQLHPDDRPAATSAWNKAVANGTVFEVDVRIRRFDGIYRPFKWRAVPVRNSLGVVNKWFGANTDLGGPDQAV